MSDRISSGQLLYEFLPRQISKIQCSELEQTFVVRFESRGLGRHEAADDGVARLGEEHLDGVGRGLQELRGVLDVTRPLALIEADVRLVVETRRAIGRVRPDGRLPNVVGTAVGDAVHRFVQVHPEGALVSHPSLSDV